MQRTKKAICLLLSLLLALSCFTCLASVTAFAADGDTSIVYGDVDGDGVVKINDATAIQRHIAEKEGFILEPGSDAFKRADVDGDGALTVQDVTLIQRYLAEFIDKFPAEDASEEDTLIVAGSEAEIFGTGWDGTNEANLMTKQADGTYTKEYTVDKAYDAVQLKSVKNGAEWIGDETGNNVTFNLTGAGTFTVTYDPEANVTTVSGDIVQFITDFEYDTVFAVGNGEGFWLNGAAWDPAYAANEMHEVAEDVWEITFENVPDGFERQIKFAIDGAWTHNFGGTFEDSGVESAAAYNGDNITFDTDDVCNVTARLDLSNFDFTTKEGATFTLTIDYGEAPTEEPTEAPTEAPTEEPTEEPVEEDTLIVAGSEPEIFGTGWDADNEDNIMTAAEDGTYFKTYTVDKAYKDVQIKVVRTLGADSDWFGDATGNNLTFNLTAAGDFTVTFAPDTETLGVTGEIVEFVTEFKYDTVYAVGNGEGWWLNGASWDPGFAANEMHEVSKDVWETEYANVADGFERQVKFSIDGTWTLQRRQHHL